MKRTLLFAFLFLVLSTGCSSWRISETLKDIESYIMERPDSAMVVLDSMDRSLLTTDRHKAHHALLHAMALDKNYIDVDDDSLASVAVKYFSRKGPEKYHARSLYYLGLAYYYQGEYNKAIVEFTKAEAAAQRSDSLYLGMTKSLQADTYARTYNDIEEQKCIYEAYNIFSKISERYYADVCRLRLVQSWLNFNQYEKADSLLEELISTQDLDTNIKVSALVTYAFRKATHENPDYIESSETYDKIFSEYNGSLMKEKDYWAWAYSLNQTGRKDEAAEMIKQLEEVDSSVNSSYWKYRILKSEAKYKEALDCFETYDNKNDEAVSSALRQSLAAAQRNYYQSQSEIAEYKVRIRNLSIVMLIITAVSVVSVLVWIFTRRIRIQSEEKEKYLKYAEEIRKQLEASQNENYPDLKRKYLEIYKSRFEMIASLYEEYVLYHGKKNAEHAIYAKVSEMIDGFINDQDAAKQLESVLDESLDGLISMLRKDVPNLREKDYVIFCFMVIGFDVTTISHLLDTSMNSIYIRKSRMKKHIEEADPENKDIYLQFLR